MASADVYSKTFNDQLKSLFSTKSQDETAIFLTLRFRSKPRTNNQHLDSEIYLNDSWIEKNFHHYWNLLNRQLFGNKYKGSKHKKTDKHQLRHLSVLHQPIFSRNILLSHIHQYVIIPPSIQLDYIKELIKTTWGTKTFFGTTSNNLFYFEPAKTDGSIEYPFRQQNDYEPFCLGSYLGGGRVSSL